MSLGANFACGRRGEGDLLRVEDESGNVHEFLIAVNLILVQDTRFLVVSHGEFRGEYILPRFRRIAREKFRERRCSALDLARTTNLEFRREYYVLQLRIFILVIALVVQYTFRYRFLESYRIRDVGRVKF